MVPLGLIRVETSSCSVLLSDDVLHQRQQSVDVHLLTRPELQVRQWPLCDLRQRLSYSLYVLMEKHIKNLTQEKNSSVIFTFKNTDEFPHLDYSIRSDVLHLFLRGRVL